MYSVPAAGLPHACRDYGFTFVLRRAVCLFPRVFPMGFPTRRWSVQATAVACRDERAPSSNQVLFIADHGLYLSVHIMTHTYTTDYSVSDTYSDFMRCKRYVMAHAMVRVFIIQSTTGAARISWLKMQNGAQTHRLRSPLSARLSRLDAAQLKWAQ